MRGEDDVDAKRRLELQGSPPHARGRPPNTARPIAVEPITPACAGKTYHNIPFAEVPSNHPRMRGEDPYRAWSSPALRGSPPHARGRLILRLPCRMSHKDHPRMRGEDLIGQRQQDHRLRITPACAGKTGLRMSVSTFRIGSPPHARGRLEITTYTGNPIRITPACAGKTQTPTLGGPRYNKRHAKRLVVTNPHAWRTKGLGSPPHARGRHLALDSLDDFLGITPACAGKTALLNALVAYI